MKNAFTFFLSFLTITLFAQLQNPSFEQWNTINNWENPAFWQTNNVNGFISVTKTTPLSNGSYAMKIVSNGISFEGKAPGYALTIFKPDVSFNVLGFTYRLDTIQGSGSFEVIVSQLNNNKFEVIGEFKTATMSKNVIDQYIPVTLLNLDSVKVEFIAKTTLTPVGYSGYTGVVVDDIHFKLKGAVNEEFIPTFLVFYNSTDKHIKIESKQSLNTLPTQAFVFDISGKEVLRKTVDSDALTATLDASSLMPGIYVVQLKSKDTILSVNKIAIRE